MAGTLESLGNDAKGRPVWRLRIYLGRDPVTKRQRRASMQFHGTRRDAERELARFVTEREAAKPTTKATVAELLSEWIRHCRQAERSISTVHGYESKIRVHIVPHLGDTPIDKLTPKMIDDFYGQMRTSGYAGSTIHQCHAILRRAFVQAMRWEWIDRNPVTLVSPPRARVSSPLAPDVAALAEILAEAHRRDEVVEAAIALAAVTGLRRGELVALHWSDVDDVAQTLWVRRALRTAGSAGSEIGPTKTRAERVIALDPVGVEVIRRLKAVQVKWADEMVLELPADPWLLPDHDLNKPMPPDRLTGAFSRIARSIGRPDLHLHSLRHFTATEMIAAGVDVRTVAGRLGHSDASVTLRVYAHALPERDRAAAEMLGARLRLPLENI